MKIRIEDTVYEGIRTYMRTRGVRRLEQMALPSAV